MKKLIELFLTFFWLGLVTFGGGLAMLPIIKHKSLKKEWIHASDWEEIVTLSQLTPGAIAVNCANLIGYRQRGILGGIAAVLGMVSGPILVITLLGLGLSTWLNNPVVVQALKGMFLVVFVLLTYAIFNLGRYAWKQWWMIPFSLVSFLLVYTESMAPWMVLVLSIIGIVTWTRLQAGKP